MKTMKFYNKDPKGLKILMGLMVLTTLLGCSKGGSDDGMDPDPDPDPVNTTISGISPTSGVTGTEVTISGTNFSTTAADNEVTFNGVAATVSSASTTQIIVAVPANATTGAVAVSVDGRNAQGPSFTVLEGNLFACNDNVITADLVLEDVEPGDAIDYIVKCAISVQGNALLTIEAGVTIAFEGEESGIFTSEGGGVKAIGTVSDPIKFIGTSDNKGVWKGMYFGSSHPENRLEYVTVRNAGRTASGQSGEKGAVQLSRQDESRAAIVNCTIDNNDGFGIFITDESEISEFSANTMTNNSAAPIGLFFNQLGALDEQSGYQGNSDNFVEVRENDLEDEAVDMAAIGVPYRFVESKRYNIQNALNIGAGNILEFSTGAGFRLGVQASDCISTTGTLNATGTADAHIEFRGVTAGKGTWLGLGFNSSSPNNKLVYCDISGGGSADLYNASQFAANITLQCESRVTIQNTTISESGGFGIYMLEEDARLQDFENNSFTANELAPVLLHFPQVAGLDTGSEYSGGNGREYIQVYGQAITEDDLTIEKLDVPYRIGRDVSGRETYVETALTILPGVILEFETAAGILLGSPGVDCIPLTGSLNAVGTAQEPIIFRGVTEGQGTWLGLGINSSTSANHLEYCEISGGGASQMYNAGGQGNLVIHCSGSVEVNNCTISDSGGWGIDFVQGGNSLDDSNNTFSNNADGNIAPN
jgi:parallel beta-helix repeat protein